MANVSRIQELLTYANEFTTSDIPDDVSLRVAKLTSSMNETVLERQKPEIIFFVYHVPVPQGSGRVYVDAKSTMDQENINYKLILKHFCSVARAYHGGCRVYLVTDSSFDLDDTPDNVTPVRFDFDANYPMFERVIAMNAFVKSDLFNSNTVFLNSDAFVNASLNAVFNGVFDIGLTYRNIDLIMPVNEGLIFASNRQNESVREFFDLYLGTYVNLDRHGDLQGVFGDEFSNIRRWRGGAAFSECNSA